MDEEVKSYENFFPEEMFKKFIEQYKNVPMRYGWMANNKTDPHGHWNFSIYNSGGHNLADITDKIGNGVVKEMWDHFKEKIGEDLILLRCYINGHTYGVDGYLHTDSDREDETTTVLYMNEEWFPNWAGETIFMDRKKTKIIESVLPKANCLVVFPSNLPHCARGVSRKCYALRQTFMFKARKRRTPTFEKLSSFLKEHGATNITHKTGSLHDHLVRVYQILEDRNFPEHVCLGAGLHSVFGTSIFTNVLIDDSKANIVKETFGDKAYTLAKLFSKIDRPKELENPEITDDGMIVSLTDGNRVLLPTDTYEDLCLIECANLEDQRGLKTDKYPRLTEFWFKKLEKNK
jgi:hypothetical protein